MTHTTFRQTIGYALVCVIFCNLVLTPFTANKAFAQDLPTSAALTPEQQAAKIQAINKGQWDGAIAVKSFTLPGLSNDESTGRDESGMISDLSSYTDENGNQKFSTMNMDQMFQGFSASTHEDYMNQMNEMSAQPNLLQDARADFYSTIDSYDDVNCDELEDEAEKINCTLSKNAQILKAIRDNEGRNEFLGADDPILTAFSPFTDGTHPYFSELQSEECVEVTTGQGEGEGGGIKATRHCLVPTQNTNDQECEIERFMDSSKIDEKVIMQYVPRGDYSDFRGNFADQVLLPCGEDENLEEGVTCIEIRTLDLSDWSKESYPTTNPYNYYTGNTNRDEWSITFAETVVITGLQQTSNSIITQSSNPSRSLADYDYAFVPGFTTGFSAGTLALFERYNQNYNGQPDISKHNFGRGECLSEEYVDVEFGLSQPDQNIGDPTNQEYQCQPPGDIDYGPNFGGGNTGIFSNVDNFQPFQNGDSTVYEYTQYTASELFFGPDADPLLQAASSATSGRMVNLVSTKFYFTNPVIDGGTDPYEIGVFENAIIDDIEDYPKTRIANILGEEVLIEIDVFDQALYSVSEHFPTNIRVEGDTVESWRLITIGRPTDRYNYQLEIEFNARGPFQVIADLHEINTQGFRPRAGENPQCQQVVDTFVQNTLQMDAVCDYLIDENNTKTTDSGVLIDLPHIGYFQFLSVWGENGNPPLERVCYDATITVSVDELDFFEEEDRDLLCYTLSGADYDNCMAGRYCSEDIVNGGEACYDIGNSLQRSFEDSCANYLSDASCTYQPTQTRCEEYVIVNGVSECLFESHEFICDEGGNGYTMPTDRETTEVVCGAPRDCMNGTCTSIAEESNDAFLRATALQNVAGEAKNNSCSISPTAENDEGGDFEACKLFSGEVGRCKQAKVFGAPDCCDPEDLGMGGINVVEYWQATKLLNASVEQMTGAGLMGNAWGAIESTDIGVAAGKKLGALNEYLTDTANDVYSFVSGEITTGWSSTMSTLGFSNAKNTLDASAAITQIGIEEGIAANGEAIVNSTTEQIQSIASEYLNQLNPGAVPDPTTVTNVVGGAVITPSMTQPVGSGFTGNCTDCASMFGEGGSQITGLGKYIAQGLNEVLKELGFENVAADLFVTKAADEAVDGSVEEIAFNSEQALGQFAEGFFQVFNAVMLAYQIYSVYRLAVNIAFACDDEDYKTTQKTKLLQTKYVGSYCSKDLFIGGCIEYTQVHCKYESVFGRIISGELNRIMAEDAGTPLLDRYIIDSNKKVTEGNVTCTGFSILDLEDIDWDRVDLSEYEQILLSSLKYNPNNMPEDFVKSDYLAGNRSGPQAGTTIKEDGTAQATLTAFGADSSRQNMTEHNTQLDDPDYMPWYTPTAPDGSSERCVVSCDVAGGYSYNGSSSLCEKTTYTDVPANYSCSVEDGFTPFTKPDGTIGCRQTTAVPISIGCRPSYVLNETTGLCEGDNVTRLTPDATCPVSYTVDTQANECVLREIVPQIINCTGHGPGYSLIDGVCIQTEIEQEAPVVICPEGDNYVVDGLDCVLTVTASKIITCPGGLIYNSQTERCVEVSTTSMPALFDCSFLGADFTLTDGLCERVTTVDADVQCDTDNGFSLDVNGNCSRLVTDEFEPISQCPVGYQPLPSDDTKCFTRILAPPLEEPYCEDPTYTLIDNSICEKITDESVPAEPKCSNGGVYDISLAVCLLERSYPATILCPDGTSYSTLTSLCEGISETIVSPSYECENPADVLSGDRCIDESVTGFSLICPDDYILDVETATCSLYDVERTVASYWCPENTTRNGSSCYEYFEAERILTCPDPSVLNDATGRCEQTVTDALPPINICPSPSFRNSLGQCVERERTPAVMTCPNDPERPWILDEPIRQCYRETVLIEPSTNVCPDDGSECAGFIYRDPVPSCADGAANLETGFCEDYIYSYPDPNRDCDTANGFSYIEQLDMCQRIVELSAISCGVDFTFNTANGTCERISTIDALPDCQEGYAFDGNVCRRVDHTAITCEVPSTSYNSISGKCEGVETQPISNECQSPYVVDPSNPPNCILPTTYTPTCSSSNEPSFYNPSTNRCEHTSIASEIEPIRNCTAGLLVDGRCFAGSTSLPTCPVGSVFNPATDRCERQLPTTSLYCVEGSLIDDGGNDVCRTVESKYPDCSAGAYYDVSSNTCIERLETTGTMVCNDNGDVFGVIDGTQCLNYRTVPYIVAGVCPEGFSANTAETCIQQLPTTAPNFTCPDGFLNSADVDGRSVFESPICVAKTVTAPTCSGDFSLVGDRCQKNDDIAPMISCNVNGELLFGIHCQASNDTSPICPANTGYSSTHDVCVQSSSVPSVNSCPTFYAYNAATQRCDSTLDESPICAVGYALDLASDVCRQIELAPECSEGYSYDPAIDQCFLHETASADTSCLPGQVDNGSGCQTLSAPLCPPGYSLDTVRDICTFIDRQVYEPNCQLPYVDDGSRCVLPEQPDCASIGGVWDSVASACILEETTPSFPQACPSGYSYLGGGLCAQIENPSYICANGGDFRDNGTSPGVDSCEEILTLPYDECAPGQTFQNGACRNTNPPQCPVGTVPHPTNPDFCQDSNTVDDPPTCTGDYTYNPTTDSCTKDLLLGPADRYCTVDEDPITEGCQIITPISDGDIICPPSQTYDPASQTCQITVSGTASCPAGETYLNGSCQKVFSPPCVPHAGLSGSANYNSATGTCSTLYSTPFSNNLSYIRSLIAPRQSAGYQCSIEDQFQGGFGGVNYVGICLYDASFQEICTTAGGDYQGLNQCFRGTGNIRNVCNDPGFVFVSDGLCESEVDSGQPPTCTSLDENGVPFVFSNGTCNGSEIVTVSPNGPYHCDEYSGDVYLSGTQCYLVDGDVSPQDPCQFSQGNLINDRCQSETVTNVPIECPANYSYDTTVNQCFSNAGFPFGDCSVGADNGSGCQISEFERPSCTNGGSTYNDVRNQCEFDQRPINPAYCPSGTPAWNLNGSICERDVEVPPNCDAGVFDAVLNACVFNPKAYDSNCLDGWTDNGASCERELTAAPDCPTSDPYDRNLNQCRSGSTGSYQYACNTDGFVPTDDPTICERYTYEFSSCASGLLVNDVCINQYFDVPSIDCAIFGDKFTYNGTSCEAPLVSQLSCPFGMVADNSLTLSEMICHQYTSQVGALSCLTSFSLSGNQCSFNYTVNPVLTCGDGYAINDISGQCERLVYDEAVHSCNDPASLLRDDKACRSLEIIGNTPVDFECTAPGFELDEFGRCVLPADGSVTEYCENPLYSLVPLTNPVEGGPQYQCELVENEYLTPDFDCSNSPTGSVYVGGGFCQVEKPVTPVLGCQTGFTLNDTGTQCERERLEVTDPIITCPEPYTLTVLNQCRLTETTPSVLVCDPLLAESTLPPPANANDAWTISNGFCEQEVIVDVVNASQFCSGVINALGECIGFIETPATPVCPDGFIYNNITQLCRGESSVSVNPISIDCPTGNSPTLSETTCSYTESFPSNGLGCPGPGWVFDEIESMCSIYLRETAQPVLCEDGQEQRFRKCYTHEEIDAEYVCPEGTTQDPSTLLCTGTIVEYKAPTVTCPTYYLTVGLSCVLTEQEQPVITCSDPSYELIGEICYQDFISTDEPPIVSCPPGFSEQTDICTFESRIDGTPECQDLEWRFNPLTEMCERENTQILRPISGCPDTFTDYVPISGNRCARTIDTQPIVLACSDGVQVDGLCEVTTPVTHTPDYCIDPAIRVGGVCESYRDQLPIISCPATPGVVRMGNGCAIGSTVTQLPTTQCTDT